MRKDGSFLNGLAPQLGLEPETYGLKESRLGVKHEASKKPRIQTPC
jgi:hypothetical protein